MPKTATRSSQILMFLYRTGWFTARRAPVDRNGALRHCERHAVDDVGERLAFGLATPVGYVALGEGSARSSSLALAASSWARSAARPLVSSSAAKASASRGPASTASAVANLGLNVMALPRCARSRRNPATQAGVVSY